jgi:hypothetical protein
MRSPFAGSGLAPHAWSVPEHVDASSLQSRLHSVTDSSNVAHPQSDFSAMTQLAGLARGARVHDTHDPAGSEWMLMFVRAAYSVAHNLLPPHLWMSFVEMGAMSLGDAGVSMPTARSRASMTLLTDILHTIDSMLSNSIQMTMQSSPNLCLIVDDQASLTTGDFFVPVYVGALRGGCVKTHFLAALACDPKDNDSICRLLLDVLAKRQVSISRVLWISTSGSSARALGEDSLLSRLRELNPFMNGHHSVPGGVSAAAAHACSSVANFSDYEATLRDLHSFLAYRMSMVTAAQILSPELNSRLQRPPVSVDLCAVAPWASSHALMVALLRQLPLVLNFVRYAGTLRDGSNLADVLYRSVATFRFVGFTHFLADVLGVLESVTTALQSTAALAESLQALRQAVDRAVSVLLQFAKDPLVACDLPEASHLRLFLEACAVHTRESVVVFSGHQLASCAFESFASDVQLYALSALQALRVSFPMLQLFDAMSQLMPESLFPALLASDDNFGGGEGFPGKSAVIALVSALSASASASSHVDPKSTSRCKRGVLNEDSEPDAGVDNRAASFHKRVRAAPETPHDHETTCDSGGVELSGVEKTDVQVHTNDAASVGVPSADVATAASVASASSGGHRSKSSRSRSDHVAKGRLSPPSGREARSVRGRHSTRGSSGVPPLAVMQVEGGLTETAPVEESSAPSNVTALRSTPGTGSTMLSQGEDFPAHASSRASQGSELTLLGFEAAPDMSVHRSESGNQVAFAASVDLTGEPQVDTVLSDPVELGHEMLDTHVEAVGSAGMQTTKGGLSVTPDFAASFPVAADGRATVLVGAAAYRKDTQYTADGARVMPAAHASIPNSGPEDESALHVDGRVASDGSWWALERCADEWPQLCRLMRMYAYELRLRNPKMEPAEMWRHVSESPELAQQTPHALRLLIWLQLLPQGADTVSKGRTAHRAISARLGRSLGTPLAEMMMRIAMEGPPESCFDAARVVDTVMMRSRSGEDGSEAFGDGGDASTQHYSVDDGLRSDAVGKSVSGAETATSPLGANRKEMPVRNRIGWISESCPLGMTDGEMCADTLGHAWMLGATTSAPEDMCGLLDMLSQFAA